MATIIFDGNYFFYKTLFIFGSYAKSGKLLENKIDQEMFIRKISTDMAHSIRTFGNPSQVVFTIDSKSWRKEIAIEDGSYKSNRDKSESNIDWDMFYKCMNEYAVILEKKGFIVSREESAEGDDLMYLWADKLYQNGEDAIIITGDRDMYQCVKFNGTNFIVVYNPNTKTRKIVAPQGFTKWLNSDDYDLFDASTFINRSKDLISEALASVPIEEIDPAYAIFEKVVIGDSGDTVPSIWTWENKGKTYRITPAKSVRMYEIIQSSKSITDINDLPNRAVDISNSINAVCKQVALPEILKPRIERNLKLVYLHRSVIPNSIVEAFDTAYTASQLKSRLSAQKYDMSYILEGTRFINAGRTFESDIFSNFNKL